MNVTMYHNPRCTKSRETLALLRDKGIEPEIIEYLKTPPDKDTLEHILSLLDLEPRGLMRRKESAYKELQLDDDNLGREALIEAMIENPILLERPVVLANGKAAIGRPPENILAIL